jgi:hypothetical protein
VCDLWQGQPRKPLLLPPVAGGSFQAGQPTALQEEFVGRVDGEVEPGEKGMTEVVLDRSLVVLLLVLLVCCRVELAYERKIYGWHRKGCKR